MLTDQLGRALCLCLRVRLPLLSDLKLFQSLSTAIFYFYLYFTTIYALRSRAVIPLACLSVGFVLAVLCNVAYPFSAKAGGQKAADEGGVDEAVEAEEGGEAERSAAVVKRPVGRTRAV